MKGLSNEKITIDKTTVIVRPKLEYYNDRINEKFDGSHLIQNNVTYNNGTFINKHLHF